jgi:hypothetical protein
VREELLLYLGCVVLNCRCILYENVRSTVAFYWTLVLLHSPEPVLSSRFRRNEESLRLVQSLRSGSGPIVDQSGNALFCPDPDRRIRLPRPIRKTQTKKFFKRNVKDRMSRFAVWQGHDTRHLSLTSTMRAVADALSFHYRCHGPFLSILSMCILSIIVIVIYLLKTGSSNIANWWRLQWKDDLVNMMVFSTFVIV